MVDSLNNTLNSKNVDFDEAELSFSIPPGTTLAKPAALDSIQTPDGTTVKLVLQQEKIYCSFSPPLKILTKEWYAENAFWDSVAYKFPKFQKPGEDSIEVSVMADSRIHQWSSAEKITKGLKETFKEIMSGTRLNAAGYSPMDDPNPMGILKELELKFSNSVVPSSSKFLTSQFNQFSMAITIHLKNEIRKINQEVGGLLLGSGEKITIRATIPQNGEDVEKWFKNKQAAMPNCDSMTITSDKGIQVLQRNPKGEMEGIICLQEVRISKGPVVTVPKLALLGDLKNKANVESGLLFTFVWIFNMNQFSGAGVGSNEAAGLAFAKTTQDNPQAFIVPGLTRNKIETVLTAQVKLALEQLFAEYFEAITVGIPNYSHERIFGMPLNRCQ